MSRRNIVAFFSIAAIVAAFAAPVVAQFGSGGEFQVNTYTTSGQYDPAVAADADGNFVIVWANCYDGDGDSCGVMAQRYTRTGTAAGTEFQINTYTTSSQAEPAVSADADGDFVVTWVSCGQEGSSCGIFGQRISSTGAAAGTEFQVNSYTGGFQGGPDVASDGDGDFVVV